MPGWMKWTIALLIGFAIIYIGFHFSWGGYVLTPFFVLNCLVLIIVVLLQSGKAADLAGAFGGAGSQTAFGPRGAATFLSRATTWCAIVFMMTSLALSVKRSNVAASTGSILEQTQPSAPAKPAAPPVQVPVQPSQAPPSAPSQQSPAQTPPPKN
jgi:preprotein translocase subunit SecG